MAHYYIAVGGVVALSASDGGSLSAVSDNPQSISVTKYPSGVISLHSDPTNIGSSANITWSSSNGSSGSFALDTDIVIDSASQVALASTAPTGLTISTVP